MLSKINSEENKRIKREVTYLSGLNSPYIVRYFQTWVEIETDPNKIAEFSEEEDCDVEEYDDESEDLGSESFFKGIKSSAKKAQANSKRTSSVERSNINDKHVKSFINALQASPVSEYDDEDSSYFRKRARTDTFESPDPKPSGRSESESQ